MKKLCLVFLALLISWPIITFGQEFNSVVLLEDSSFVNAAIDSIRSHGGMVKMAIITDTDNIIMCSMPPNAKQLIGQAGITEVLFDKELKALGKTEGPLSLCEPLLYPDLFEAKAGSIPAGKEMEPDVFFNELLSDQKTLGDPNDASQLVLQRSIYLVGDQAWQVLIVEGSDDHKYDWLPSEKEEVKKQFIKGLTHIQTVAHNSYSIDITWIVRFNEVTITDEPSYCQYPGCSWMGAALTKAGLGGIEDVRESMIRQYRAHGAGVAFIYSDADDDPGNDTLPPYRVIPRVMPSGVAIEDTVNSAHWGSCWARMYIEDLREADYYYGGGYCSLSKSASGWGMYHLWSTTVHEIFHCYGAMDEYASSGCGTGQLGGYLHGQNYNCCGSSPCIMRHSVNEWGSICPYTIQMIGWSGGGTSINQLPQSLFLPSYRYIFFIHAAYGDFVTWWTLDGDLIEEGKRATKYNTYYDPNDSSLCGIEGDGRNFYGNVTAPDIRLYTVNNSGDPMRTPEIEIGGNDLNIILSNFRVEDNHILKWDKTHSGQTRVEITGPGVKKWPVWDRAIRGVCDFGFLPDTTYNAKIFAWRPAGSVSPVYNYPFRVHRGMPRAPIVTGKQVELNTPENFLVISWADTNYYIEGIRVEKWNGYSWDSAAVIPRAGASRVSEKFGSKVDTLRAISFNPNGFSTPTITTIKNAPNPPSKLAAGVYLRPKHSLGKLVGGLLGKKAPDSPPPVLVATNQINMIWEPPVNQLDSIAYYKISYSYWRNCLPPPGWCDVYPTFYTAPICSTHYNLYPLPLNNEVTVRVFAYDHSGDSSACLRATLWTGGYDAHPKPPDECVKPVPAGFALSQNYPNPFNLQTVISYALPSDGQVKLIIYNILGQKVRTLADGEETAGYKQVIWDGKNDRGEEVSSGIYFCVISTDKFYKSVKMSLVK